MLRALFRQLKIPLLIVVGLSFGLGAYWGIKTQRQRSAAARAAGSAQLRVLALKGILSPELITAFEESRSVHVELTEAATPEELWSRVENPPPNGASQFDVVTLFSYQVPLASGRLRLQPPNAKLLSNASAISPDFRDLPALANQGRTVPVLWGLTGLLYNSSRVQGNAPSSWKEALSDARLKGKIGILSSTADLSHLLSLPDADEEHAPEGEADAKADTELTASLKRSLSLVASSARISADTLSPASLLLSSEPPWVVQISQGETAFPPVNGAEWKFVLPEEQALLWVLSFGILSEAKGLSEAHQFLDYLLQKESALALTNFTRQASTNRLVEESNLDARLKPSYLRQVPLTKYEVARAHSRALEIRALVSRLTAQQK